MDETDILARLDHPAVNSGIFFPRSDSGRDAPAGSEDLEIEVSGGDRIAARYHRAPDGQVTILHFHGNGEIVADYDDLVPLFHGCGASVMHADFRGYGRSTGSPSLRALVADAHPVLDALLELLASNGDDGPVIAMGRSLGSAPAIELAARRPEAVEGLVVESGFARTMPLLGLLGITVSFLGLDVVDGIDNEDKMARVECPVLFLHAESDIIVPLWHAERNYDRAPGSSRRLVVIPGADHNSIIAKGGRMYWGAIRDLVDLVCG